MAHPTSCEHLIDAWSSTEPPSPEFLEHLATCENCSALAGTFRHVRENCHLNPPGSLISLRAKVLQNALPPLPSSLPVPPVAPLPRFSLLVATVIFLGLAAGIVFLHGRPGEPLQEVSSERTVSIAAGSESVEIPGRATVEFEGPAYVLVASSQMQVFWGKTTIQGKPDGEPIGVITPHGRIDGRCARFTCVVLGTGTMIEVLGGSIHLQGADCLPRELVAGQKATLIGRSIPSPSTASASFSTPASGADQASHSMYQVDDDRAGSSEK